ISWARRGSGRYDGSRRLQGSLLGYSGCLRGASADLSRGLDRLPCRHGCAARPRLGCWLRVRPALRAAGGSLFPRDRHRRQHRADRPRDASSARGVRGRSGRGVRSRRRHRGRGGGGAGGTLVRPAGLLRGGVAGGTARRGRRPRELWAGAGRSRRRSGHRPLLLAGPGPVLAARAPPRGRRLSVAAVSVRADPGARPRDAGQLDVFGSDRLRGDVVGGMGAGPGGGTGTARGVPARACSGLGRRRSSATGSLDPVAPGRPAVAGQPDWTDGLIQPYLCSVTPRKRTTPHSGPSELAAPFRTSEDLFRLMVENVKDYAIFMLDPGGRVASWNAGAERIKGYSAEEIIGQHFSRFYPPEDVQARKPERELQVAAAEGQWAEEGWRVGKEGSRFWASVVITAVRSADGELLGFGKVTRDVTQRHEMERALRQTAQRFHLIVEGAKDYALLMLDPAGRVVSWNAGAERLKGYRAEEIMGQHFSRFYPPEDVQAGKAERALQQAVAEGRWEDEGWRVRQD